MLWRARKSLAKDFEPASCAAILRGPKQRRPAARKRSTTPATSGPSGPTTVRSTCAARASCSRPSRSVTGTAAVRTPGSRAVPALPGATITSETRVDCLIFQARACSRPPLPITRTFIGKYPVAASVAEVAHASEDHGHVVGVGGGDHFRVAHRAARLDHRLDASLARGIG